MTTDEGELGRPVREDGGWKVRFERRLAHDRAKVWAAITESEHLAHWLPCDIVGERREGARIELPFWPAQIEAHGIDDDEQLFEGEIRIWDPPSVFEWTWGTNLLRWELAEDGDGTLLTFTTWLGDDDEGAVRASAGYHVCLDHLTTLLDAGTAGPLAEADTGPWERRYREAVGAVCGRRPAR
jgi:uncharacterized protein YndB with AHSA1/START domain